MAKKVRQTPVQSIRVYLIKNDVKKYKDALRTDITFDEYEIAKKHKLKGKLFVRKAKKSKVTWAQFLQTGISDTLNLHSLAHAAVLFIETKKRMFAVVFGMGRYMLKDTKYEADFGILSALNTVNPESIRSADTYHFEAVAVHKRTQASRTTSLTDLELDPNREHVRSITGKSTDKNLAESISGNDAGLGANVRIKFGELATYCENVLKAYKAKAYQNTFPRFDNLRTLTDKSKIAALEKKLIARLQEEKLKGIYLSPPEPISYEDFSGFSFTAKGDITSELEISEYIALQKAAKKLDKVSIEKLKSHRAFLRKETADEPLGKWSIYKSLICEFKEGSKVYILMNGAWHQVSAKFVKKVEDSLTAIPEVDIGLPKPIKATTEPGYLAEVKKYGKGLLVMDRMLAKCEEAGHGIEVCDVITKKREYVHVKRKEGGSKELSHLFMQGRNSTFALLRDQQFRDQARVHLKKLSAKDVARIPKSTPKPGSFKVVYAIMGDFKGKGFIEALPFFSKMSLMGVFQELSERGVQVEVCKVDT